MRLTYRGASYEFNNSPLEVRESDIISRHGATQQRCQSLQENNYPLTYRGNRYTTAQVIAALSTPATQTAQPLTYRGVKYIRNADGTTQLVSPRRDVIPHTPAAAVKELSRVHQDNIRRNLERRLQAARERGDHTLVSLLEAESKQLAL